MGGLNRTEREETIDLVRRVSQAGITVLLIEHVMKAVQALANRLLVLHHGQRIAQGPPAEVLRDQRVIEVYLGGQARGRTGNDGGGGDHVRVTDLNAGYAGSEVLHSLSLQVGAGESVVVLGPNGHGKTTLLRAISGLIKAESGVVEFDGRVISNKSASDIVAARVIYIPQGDLPFPELTVMETC